MTLVITKYGAQGKKKLNWLPLHPAITKFGTANKLKTPEGTPTTQFKSLTSHHYYKSSPLTVSTNAGYQAAAGE